MDPDVTLKMIEEAAGGDYEERACFDLREWLAADGFSPNWARFPFGTDRFVRWLIDASAP